MKSGKMKIRIALAQINSTVGDLSGNRDRIIGFIGKARKYACDILVFPEMAVSGYPPEDLLLKPHFIRDNGKELEKISRHCPGMIVIIGCPVSDGKGNVYNAAAVIGDKKIRCVYHKKELPNYAVFDERRYFTPQSRNAVFRIKGVKFGVNICEDIWASRGPYIEQVRAGAGILFNISASPYHAGKRDERKKLLTGRAKATKTFICYVNLVGGQDELVFDGGSFIIGPEGGIIASGKEFEEDLVMADIHVKPGKKRGGNSHRIREVSIPFKGTPKDVLIDPDQFLYKRSSRLEEIYKALVLGTEDYVYKNGFKKAVLGISGGIDSALTAVIARDALGPENVTGISMPSPYTSGGARKDSVTLARNLGIGFREVPIDDLFTAYKKILDGHMPGKVRRLVKENLQARIRGNMLMAFSNEYGWMLLTTGNKSETAVGYCTLYGDMAGGFAVIKDVPKTLVYELAEHVNREGLVIPPGIIKRAPSAELSPGQKDTDAIPPYEYLDPVLKGYIENDKRFDDLKKDHLGTDLIKKVINMVDTNEYKRRQAPPGIKITPKAFGRDRRFPITNKYRESGR